MILLLLSYEVTFNNNNISLLSAVNLYSFVFWVNTLDKIEFFWSGSPEITTLITWVLFFFIIAAVTLTFLAIVTWVIEV